MSKLLVFTVTFFSILGLTLIFPFLPPGDLLLTFLNISFESWSIFGISGTVIVSGIINGILWGLIFAGIYVVYRTVTREALPPMPSPQYIPAPVPPKTEEIHLSLYLNACHVSSSRLHQWENHLTTQAHLITLGRLSHTPIWFVCLQRGKCHRSGIYPTPDCGCMQRFEIFIPTNIG